MGNFVSPCRRNNSVNEQAKLSPRHSDKHEAPKRTTPESPEDQRNVSGDDDFKGHSSSKSKTAEWQIQYTRPNGDARTEDSGLSAKNAKDARISATPSTSMEEDKVESVNRQAPDGLEQQNEDRENKHRKTKEKKRHYEVSYTTETDENHATDSANDRKKIQEYESKVERLQAEVIRLTQENDTLLNRHDEVLYTTKTEENHARDSANGSKKMHEYEKKVESLKSDVMKLRKENETLLNRLTPDGLEQQNEDRKKKPQKTKEEKRHDDVSYTTNTNENHATDITIDRKKLHEYERKVGCLEADVIKLREEKDTLLNRLSEIGAITLTENNPKVTDLSDENRPEKVVEQLSEIYDNEWTDAYEHLTKRKCKQMDWSVKQLLDVLKETYTICVSSTQEKKKALQEAISNYLGLSERDATDLDLKETKKRIQEHRKKMFQRNIPTIEGEVRDRLKKKLEKEIYECLSDYIGKCVIICWNMCTKEPPMYLDFGDWKQTAQSGDEKPANMPFDKLKFVTYTKSGDYIDYVVWPAVYTCEGGPLMRKGVAQGSKLITDKMEEKENENESKMVKY